MTSLDILRASLDALRDSGADLWRWDSERNRVYDRLYDRMPEICIALAERDADLDPRFKAVCRRRSKPPVYDLERDESGKLLYPSSPEIGARYRYLCSISGCTMTTIEWCGVAGWRFVSNE